MILSRFMLNSSECKLKHDRGSTYYKHVNYAMRTLAICTTGTSWGEYVMQQMTHMTKEITSEMTKQGSHVA